ncbi:Uncharacterised protein [Serratia marcescens]|nr:Uncharacterised protein [Serratia marcescens]
MPRQLTERLPRFARRAAVEQALVHRVARRQRIRRRRHRPLVRSLRHAGEARAVAPDAQRHPGRLVAQPGTEEQVVRRHRVKLPAHPLLRAQDGVLLAQQAAHLALRQQVGTVLQRHRHLTAADRRRSAALDPIALAVRPHFHRVARARFEADVARHVQGADRVARRHGAAAAGGQRTDRAAAADDAAALHADGRGDRAVDGQQPLIDQRRAGIGVGAGQLQGSRALFGQAAVAGNVVGVDFPSTVDIITFPGVQRTGIHLGAPPRNIGDKLGRAIGHARRIRDAELRRNIFDGIEHARAVDSLAQVDHPPAVERVDARRTHVGGGGFQHVGNLRRAHVREALQQHRHRAGHVRRRHRGAVFIAVVRHQVGRIGTVGHGAVDFAARRRDAEAGGIAAAGREAADGIRHAVGRCRILRHAGDRQPVRRDVRHEVGQPADHIRLVVVAVVAGGEQHQNVFARRIDRALIACAGQAAEQRFDLIELFLRILQLKVQRVRIAAAVGQEIGNTDAPAVVDHPCTAVDHRLPAGIGDGAVQAEEFAVGRAVVIVIDADHLRIEGHAVHADAVAVRRADPRDVHPMIAQCRPAIEMEGAVKVKAIAGVNAQPMRIGVGAVAFGDHVDQFAVAGELGMVVDRGVENAHLLPFAGITGGVGLIGVDRPQPPVGVEFGAAPAGRIAGLAVHLVRRRLCIPRQRHAADQRVQPPRQAASVSFAIKTHCCCHFLTFCLLLADAPGAPGSH